MEDPITDLNEIPNSGEVKHSIAEKKEKASGPSTHKLLQEAAAQPSRDVEKIDSLGTTVSEDMNNLRLDTVIDMKSVDATEKTVEEEKKDDDHYGEEQARGRAAPVLGKDDVKEDNKATGDLMKPTDSATVKQVENPEIKETTNEVKMEEPQSEAATENAEASEESNKEDAEEDTTTEMPQVLGEPENAASVLESEEGSDEASVVNVVEETAVEEPVVEKQEDVTSKQDKAIEEDSAVTAPTVSVDSDKPIGEAEVTTKVSNMTEVSETTKTVQFDESTFVKPEKDESLVIGTPPQTSLFSCCTPLCGNMNDADQDILLLDKIIAQISQPTKESIKAEETEPMTAGLVDDIAKEEELDEAKEEKESESGAKEGKEEITTNENAEAVKSDTEIAEKPVSEGEVQKTGADAKASEDAIAEKAVEDAIAAKSTEDILAAQDKEDTILADGKSETITKAPSRDLIKSDPSFEAQQRFACTAVITCGVLGPEKPKSEDKEKLETAPESEPIKMTMSQDLIMEARETSEREMESRLTASNEEHSVTQIDEIEAQRASDVSKDESEAELVPTQEREEKLEKDGDKHDEVKDDSPEPHEVASPHKIEERSSDVTADIAEKPQKNEKLGPEESLVDASKIIDVPIESTGVTREDQTNKPSETPAPAASGNEEGEPTNSTTVPVATPGVTPAAKQEPETALSTPAKDAIVDDETAVKAQQNAYHCCGLFL